nr:YhaN family protein [uncultured Dongia sp.]
MRIEELRLCRYGLHQDRVLSFPSASPGKPDLHIVAGPNATGKSSAREAVTDLLYGFQNVSPWAIGYEPRLLRIGAVITDRAGRKLDFVRLKGRKGTVVDANETPIDENLLKSFLGVPERALYRSLYSLDQAALRDGGEAMLSADSDVGQTIFAAASGLATLSAVQATLAEEADAIGSIRKSSQKPVWLAESTYADAIARAQEASLRIEDWNAADRALKEAIEAVEALQQRQIELEAERDLLDRHLRVVPLLSDLARLRAELGALGGGQLLAEGFGARWKAAREAHDRLTVMLDSTRTAKERADAARKALPISAGPLPGFAGEIEFLNTQIGNIRILMEDEGKLDGVEYGIHDRLQDRAKSLGGNAEDVDLLIEKLPTPQLIATIRDLITKHEVLASSLENAKVVRATAERAVKETEAALAELGNPKSPGPAAGLLQTILSLGADARKSVKDRDALAAAKAAEVAKLQNLTGWSGKPADLPHSIFPSLTTLSAAKITIETARREEALAHANLEAAEAEVARIEAEQDTSAVAAVPTEDAVAAERMHRDHRWAAIRQMSLKGETSDEISLDAYETRVRKADQLIDQRLGGADKIAAQCLQETELQRRKEAKGRAERTLEQATSRVLESSNAAAALWQGTGYVGEVGTPDAMLNWLQHKERVVEAVNARIITESDAEASGKALADKIVTLRQAAALLLVALPDALESAAVVEVAFAKVNAALVEAQNAWTRSQQLAVEQKKRKTEAESAADGDKEARTAIEAWATLWKAAMPAINLAEDMAPAAAITALEQWDAFSRDVQLLKEARRRADGIRNDLSAHRTRIEALVSRIWPEGVLAVEDAPDNEHWYDWPSLLYGMLGATKKTADAIERADGAVEEATAGLTKTETAEAATANALKKLRAEGALSEEEDVDAAIETSTKRRNLAAGIEDKTKALHEAGDGEAEESLRTALGEALRTDVQTAASRNSVARIDLRAELQRVVEQRLSCRNALDALEKKSGAGVAQHLALSQAAKVGDLTRRWMRLTAARQLLDATIERYRQEHEGEFIRRANEIFIAIAGKQAPDHFVRLEVDYERPEEPELIVVRDSGTTARVSALSEGTRDQLWLALRIAALEQRVKDAEPMPFLADDLFASSDKSRAEAGLLYLAELAKSTQVILFTHHDYIVSAAKAILGDSNVQSLTK